MKITFFPVKILIVMIAMWAVLSPAFAETADPAAKKAKWKETLIKERQKKDQYFKTNPTSPMAGVKRLTVTDDKKNQNPVFVVENKSTREVTLSKSMTGTVLFEVKKTKNGWMWKKHAPGITATYRKKPVKDGTVLKKPALFRGGQCTIQAYPADYGLALLVFDPKRPELKAFSHLYYFKPDAAFAVNATLKKYDKPEKITVGTSQNLKKTYYRYAALHFKIGGKDYKLSAFKSSLSGGAYGDYLFIPFADQTSGKETYEVGRFLEIDEPKSDTFILDFNRCFNPLCNYSPAYNCPIPPLENYLEVRIAAGEKVYPIKH